MFLTFASLFACAAFGAAPPVTSIAPALPDPGRVVEEVVADGDAIVALPPITDISQIDPCDADWNGSGTNDTADLYEFVNGWIGGDIGCDFDQSGELDKSDIFLFVSAWLAGC